MIIPLTDAEMNYSPEEWAEALAEDPSCMRAYLAAAEERGRSGAEERIAELERKFHAQRALVEAAHLAFHEVAGVAYGHTPDEDNPAAMIRLVAKETEERGRRSGVEERDELRAALIAARPFVADHFQKHALGINAKYHLDLLHRIDAALAPRDSAPCPDGDPLRGCQKPMDKPRDSGKEG